MTKQRRNLIIAGVLIALVAIVVALFIYNNTVNTDPVVQDYVTSTGETPQTIDNPTVETDTSTGSAASVPVDNSSLQADLAPTEQMQQVIDTNQSELNNQEVIDQLAPSYPSNVIPIYKANAAADSADIVTDNGRPGWTAEYGSDASTEDIEAFYTDLLGSTQDYATSTEGDTETIQGTVDNCSVKITVAPNNPERTGLNDNTSVAIFIERL